MLKAFRSSRSDFHRRFIKGEYTESDSPALLLGSAVHAMVLEPDLFNEMWVVAPKFDKRTKAGKQAFEEWKIENGGKTAIDEKVYLQAQDMAKALQRDTEAQKWLYLLEGVAEQTTAWMTPVAEGARSLKCKCKPDRLVPVSMNSSLECDVVVDLKTTSAGLSEREIARTAAMYDYHCQAAWYMDGVRAVNGDEPVKHVSIFVSKQTLEVACVQYGKASLDAGRQINMQTVSELYDCMTFDLWNGRMANKLTSIELPEWSYRWDK
jgi:exodeoxyribonuclease VIII